VSVKYSVPFISNTSDDMHCLQAAYMSIAQHFDKNFSIPMQEWSELTGFEEGKGTWANAGLVWFKNHGYDVKHLELFDYEAFMKKPQEYMVEIYGEEAGQWGYEHTNIEAEIDRMKEMLAEDIVEQRNPSLDDIKTFLDNGYLARATVNSNKLNNLSGYVGHAVVIIGYDEEALYIHDPGLPAIADRKVLFADFEDAWGAQGRELDAIRMV